jgi:predicted MFS family arabinose efflux permease
MDYRGLVLIAGGVALSVFGFQQSTVWGWSNPGIGLSIAAGLALIVIFFFVERKTDSPLMKVHIFNNRAFFVENLVLGISMLTFIPIFFFASEYAQIALGKSAQQAGLYLLYFFAGFATASQIGGRILDKRGAKRPVVIGCALAAVGFGLWASKVTQLDFSNQVPYVILAGFGMGFMLTPASTDAVNRASRISYGEATGITQTVRNFAASLGLAILGTVLVDQMRSRITTTLIGKGLSAKAAAAAATKIAQSQGGNLGAIPHYVQLDFAYSIRTVFYAMAAVMAVAAVVAKFGLQPGVQEETEEAPANAS